MKDDEREIPMRKERENKFWLKSFDALASITRIHGYETKGLEQQLKCGLDLWLAKLSLSHGAWNPYLLRCEFPSLSTAYRRRQLAVEFLLWSEIVQKGKPSEAHVIAGLEMVHAKSFKVNDFRQHIFQLNRDKFIDELAKATGAEPSPPAPSLNTQLGFNLRIVLKGIDRINDNFHAWGDTEQGEVISALQMTEDNCRRVREGIEAYRAINNRQPISV